MLRKLLESNNAKKPRKQKNLYVYDKAVTDYHWWDQQKVQQNFMISVLKESSTATGVETIPFDRHDEVNTGVESYDIYQTSQGIQFSLVTYRDPETEQVYRFITTLPTAIRPGCVAMLYYKRWTIEKAFNNTKSDFKERKAWSSNKHSLNNQMRLTAITYNLMRVFEELSKQQEPELIHPSDKKYAKALEKRQDVAKKKGRFVNPLLFQARISRISSYTIRAAQNAIVSGKSMLAFMAALVGRLLTRDEGMVVH